VYVSNEDSRNITVIDATTDSVVSTIEVGTRPRGVKVSPDGRTVYVALSGSPKCPPTMPDAECEKLKTDPSKDGVAVVMWRPGRR
jgi:YVTN family beta-propeller protein